MAVHRISIGRTLTLAALLACCSAAGASQVTSGFIQFTGRIVTPPLRLIATSSPIVQAPSQRVSQLELELRPQDRSRVSVAVALPTAHLAAGVRGQCVESPQSAPFTMPAGGCHFGEQGGRVLLTAAPGSAVMSTVVRISYD